MLSQVKLESAQAAPPELRVKIAKLLRRASYFDCRLLTRALLVLCPNGFTLANELQADPFALVTVATIFDALGEYDAAEFALQGIDLEKDLAARHVLANIKFHRGQPDLAMHIMEAPGTHEIDPRLAEDAYQEFSYIRFMAHAGQQQQAIERLINRWGALRRKFRSVSGAGIFLYKLLMNQGWENEAIALLNWLTQSSFDYREATRLLQNQAA